jgi:PKD repeat protein
MVAGSHTYSQPGIYAVQLTVFDVFGQFDTSTYEFLVVYDPAGGFVSGGGWIDSPAGAYKPDPSLTGKASFGFVSKYKKGTNRPTGNTQFQFKVADLNFQSDSYQWLVVNQNGTRAQYRGDGTINGAASPENSNYQFMLWATDGKAADAPDTFRIKIWDEDESGLETIVYDNGVEQSVGDGSITVHRGKSKQ